MATETFPYPDPPTQTDNVDGTQSYNMGVAFTVDEAVECSGVEWRVPNSVSAPAGGVHVVSLWKDGVRVRNQSFTPTPGVKQQVPFTSQGNVTLNPGEALIAAVFTVHYVFTSGAAVYPVDVPSGRATATASRLTSNGNPTDLPDVGGTAIYHVSPIIEVAEEAPPVALSGALVMPPFTLSGTLDVANPSAGGPGPAYPEHDPLNPLQAAFVTAMRADTTLMGLLPGGVNDEVREPETRDYLVLADALSLPDHTHDKYGREITQTFHIWTKSRGMKRAQTVMDRVNQLFDHRGGALSVSGHKVVLIRNEFQQVLRDPDPEWRQGLMRFRIHTEQLGE